MWSFSAYVTSSFADFRLCFSPREQINIEIAYKRNKQKHLQTEIMNFCFANEIKIKTFEKLNSMKKQEARTFDVIGFSQKGSSI